MIIPRSRKTITLLCTLCIFCLLFSLLFIPPFQQISYSRNAEDCSFFRSDRNNGTNLYRRSYCERFNNSEHIFSSSILKKQEYDINVYLRALYNGVKLVQLPESDTFEAAVADCIHFSKPRLEYSQHSIEQRIPELLTDMSKVDGSKFALLWRHNSSNIFSSNDFKEPLFYYLQTYLYFVIMHSRDSNLKENWEAGIKYFKETADFIVKTDAWKENMGIDFISPASHPMSGPMKVHPANLNLFIRQSFLRTDFDFSGHSPKDITIPYYVPFHNNEFSNQMNRTLLFFAGGDNPPGGLRSQFQKSFLELAQRSDSETNLRDVFFTTSSSLSSKEYSRYMSRSDFCLMLRGDTASSKRLFSAVSYGCIPVIISDWIPLPFEALLDYSHFTLRFSESSFRNADGLLSYLRTEVGAERKASLQRNLLLARSLLLYRSERELPAEGGTECFLLNPVSLIFLEAFIRRKKYCDELTSPQSSVLCVRLYRRLKVASSEPFLSLSPRLPSLPSISDSRRVPSWHKSHLRRSQKGIFDSFLF